MDADMHLETARNGWPLIKVENLHKIYEMGDTKVHALRGISLEIHRGEFVAIMGASGSGKSTFMNLVGCLDSPTEGTYLLDNTNVALLSRIELASIRNKHVGFVFQGFNLLSRTTALENVELPLIYAAMRTWERHKRSRAALDRVGLGDRVDHIPSQLSVGRPAAAGRHCPGAGQSSFHPACGRAYRQSRQPDQHRDHGCFPGVE
jgi:putative ABC transport system ATP-binding protein